ncbi:hypothetical protein J7412_02950 [Shimia sp. R9_3]|nr:hypothetical protein [Shimia sp. R9_3]
MRKDILHLRQGDAALRRKLGLAQFVCSFPLWEGRKDLQIRIMRKNFRTFCHFGQVSQGNFIIARRI